MTLLERAELAGQLRSAASSAAAGAGSLVVVAGEAGAGKTSLVREVLKPSASAWGWCDPLATPRPLGPFLDLARRIWPGDDDVPDGVVLRERLLRWLERDAVPLVVEDAHWVDAASADVLRFVGRRIGTTCGLLVVTTRTEVGPDHPLRRVLGDLTSAGPLLRLEVPPLSAHAVARLVADSDLDADEAFRLTRGNPFLVQQLVLTPPGQVGLTVRDAVSARLAGLAPATRAVVELLSVVPGRAPRTLVGNDLALLDPAVVAGFVRFDGAAVEFRHELVRQAVEEDLTPGRRQQLHAEVLRRLTTADPTGAAEPAVLAFHARRAGDLAATAAAERAAGRRAAALGSHREAAEHYRRAGDDAARAGDDPAERVQLELALSQEEQLVGDDAGALAAARRALELLPADADAPLRAAALQRLGRVTPLEAEAHRLAMAAVAELEPGGPTPELAAAQALVATNRMLARDLAEAQSWAVRAVHIARSVGDEESEAVGETARGSAMLLLGDEAGEEHLRRAIGLAAAAGRDGEVGRGWANLVSAAGEARAYALSDAAAAEAAAYFAARDLDGYAAYTSAWHARCLFEQGRWDAAEAQLAGLLDGGRRISLITEITALTVRGRLRARRGEADVHGPLDAAGRLAGGMASLQRTGPVAAARAEAIWLTEDADAGPGLDDAYRLAVERGHPWLVGELGLWLWRHGRLDTLPPAAAEPYRLHVGGRHAAAADAWLVLGCPYEAGDAWSDAGDEHSLRRALDVFTALGAGPARRRVARRLRELGVRSIPRGAVAATRSSPDGLTAREAEVLRWVVAGHTDAEIAARLFLSPRTVNHHVSAVLRKTGARSRRELQARGHPG